MRMNAWEEIRQSKSFGIIKLHEEIIEFCRFMEPTELEHKIRLDLVAKVKQIMLSRWTSCQVHVFGSFANGLYYPTSDIDMVILGDWCTTPLRSVENILKQTNFATNIKVIKAKVPIVKFTDIDSKITVDISFNKENGIKNVEYVKEMLCKNSNLKYLFIIVKQFLRLRDISETYTGGMSSYLLMLLCISFFQHQYRNVTTEVNLGVVLLEFFELYGKIFNYFNTGIVLSGDGSYKIRIEDEDEPNSLYIEDPFDNMNVGKSCYGLFQIRNSFFNAFLTLQNCVIPNYMAQKYRKNESYIDIPSNESVLGSIVWISNDVIEAREYFKANFKHLVNNDESKMEYNVKRDISLDNSEVFDSQMKISTRKRRNKKLNQIKNRSHKPRKWEFYRNRRPKSYNDLFVWSQENIFNLFE